MILQIISQNIRDYCKIGCYENLRPNDISIDKYTAILEFNEDSDNTVDSCNEVVSGRNFKLMLWSDINNNEVELHNLIELIKVSIKILENTNKIWNIPLDQMSYRYAGKDKNTNQKVYELLFYMEYND